MSIAGAKLGCRDPDGEKLLETALRGEADCLITRDWDLLEMSSFHDIPILTPGAFWISGHANNRPDIRV